MRNIVFLGELDRPGLQDAGAEAGELEHFIIADAVDLACVLDDAGVGGEDSVDVGVVFADVGLEDGADGDEGGVAPAAAEGGVIALGGDALEAGDDDDFSGGELVENAFLVDGLDAGFAEGVVGDEADLAAGEADGLVALGVRWPWPSGRW